MENCAFNKPIYVVDGARTPFLKARSRGPFSASDLAVAAGRFVITPAICAVCNWRGGYWLYEPKRR